MRLARTPLRWTSTIRWPARHSVSQERFLPFVKLLRRNLQKDSTENMCTLAAAATDTVVAVVDVTEKVDVTAVTANAAVEITTTKEDAAVATRVVAVAINRNR